jgi:lysophospholipase L1-like esterase
MGVLVIGVVLMIVSSIVVALSLERNNQNSLAGTIRVACIGDSITEGTEYPNDLWMLLGTNRTVGNFGYGGSTVSLESDTPYMNQSEFEQAKRFQPNIVIIMLGTNDATATPTQHIQKFVDDYKKLINEFQTLPSKPKIWLVKPPPIFNNGTGLSTPYFEQAIIPRIEQVATETGLPLIDVYSSLASHPEYFWDGVHPNNEGANVIATTIYNAIVLEDKSV